MEDKEIKTNKENRGLIDEMTKYRIDGGKISYLMKNYKGVRAFSFDALFARCIPAERYLEELKEKFPNIPEDERPSIYTVRNFKKKINKAESGTDFARSTALAMRDEVRNMQAIQNLNLFEEEQKLYNKSKDLLAKVESVMTNAFNNVKNMSMAPDFFWKTVENYQRVLEQRGHRLSKLDDLAVRYGYAPPKKVDPKVAIMNQQNLTNVTINTEVEKIIKDLDIKSEDERLYDDKFFKTTVKQISENVYDGRQDFQGEAEVMEE